jgi:hypothetical protein
LIQTIFRMFKFIYFLKTMQSSSSYKIWMENFYKSDVLLELESVFTVTVIIKQQIFDLLFLRFSFSQMINDSQVWCHHPHWLVIPQGGAVQEVFNNNKKQLLYIEFVEHECQPVIVEVFWREKIEIFSPLLQIFSSKRFNYK